MGKKYAGAGLVDGSPIEVRGERTSMCRVAERNADDLQSVEIDFLISQHPNSGLFDRPQIAGIVAKLLVIPSDKIDTMSRPELSQRRSGGGCVNRSAIVEIARNEYDVGAFIHDLCDDAFQKSAVVNVPEVQVADQRRRSSAP